MHRQVLARQHNQVSLYLPLLEFRLQLDSSETGPLYVFSGKDIHKKTVFVQGAWLALF